MRHQPRCAPKGDEGGRERNEGAICIPPSVSSFPGGLASIPALSIVNSSSDPTPTGCLCWGCGDGLGAITQSSTWTLPLALVDELTFSLCLLVSLRAEGYMHCSWSTHARAVAPLSLPHSRFGGGGKSKSMHKRYSLGRRGSPFFTLWCQRPACAPFLPTSTSSSLLALLCAPLLLFRFIVFIPVLLQFFGMLSFVCSILDTTGDCCAVWWVHPGIRSGCRGR